MGKIEVGQKKGAVRKNGSSDINIHIDEDIKGNDAKEGVDSFLEKRPPDFPNKVSKDMPEYYPWWDEKKFS